MTITLNLTDEQTDALNAVVAAANAALAEDATPYTSESYLAMVLTKCVESYARTAYDESVRCLGTGAAQLDYATRKALIAQIESQLPTP